MHFYILVRKDLSLPQQMVQAAHAANESGQIYGKSAISLSLVLCETKNETELLIAANELEMNNIPFILFREPDIDNQATALATLPLNTDQREKLKSWQLWREN